MAVKSVSIRIEEEMLQNWDLWPITKGVRSTAKFWCWCAKISARLKKPTALSTAVSVLM